MSNHPPSPAPRTTCPTDPAPFIVCLMVMDDNRQRNGSLITHFVSESTVSGDFARSIVATAAYPTKVAQVHVIEEWKDARTT
jgi:hypothetical protein